MQFEKKFFRCSTIDISPEEAVESLKSSKDFVEGSEITAIQKDGDELVATVFSPVSHVKEAERPFPPNDENVEDDVLPKPKADESSDSDNEGTETPKHEEKDHKDESKEEKEIESHDEKSELSHDEVILLLKEILNILKPTPMPSPRPAGPPGAPPPPGPPGGPLDPKPPQEIIHRRGLKPGEAPPGIAPIGTPSFSSTQNGGRQVSLSHLASIQAFAPKQGSFQDAYNDLTAKFSPYGFKVKQLTETDDHKGYAAILSR
jgi:hypothetical protein